MRKPAWVEAVLWGQRGHLFPWAPVCVAAGIGGYFALRVEPGPAGYAGLVGLGLGMALVAARRPGGMTPLAIAVALAALGFCLAGARAHLVAAPKLDFRYYGPIEGRVVGIDRSASDAMRVTLDRVRLFRMDPAEVPHRVRVSLHGGADAVSPGQRIMTTGHLSPPQGPAEPGGFDFRRYAWFQGLGAVGYTRTPVVTAAPPDGGLAVFRLRMAASRMLRDRLPGDTGGFAAAVTTGDRSGMTRDALDALRASNLAHLLAISGLHMGLLAGVVFAGLRLGLLLIPAFALRVPVRKIAAIGALAAAAAYLALSGGSIATERAFIMVAVALIALLVDRRALSLRAVAAAALIVLALRPEALLSPGFQMSFAATTALVAVFTALRGWESAQVPGWLRPPLAVVISSAVAGAATAPVAAAHFNAVAQYGLLANVLSVPVMASVVIPAAVIAACLAPLGWAGPALTVMGWGLDWILGVAHWVAGWPDARIGVVSPGPWVLPLVAIGALWIMLWQGRGRWAGTVPLVVAFALWSGAERPLALATDSGGLVGVMTADGRALSKPKGSGFVARVWLENDGDLVQQADAAERWPQGGGKVRRADLGQAVILHVAGKRAAAAFPGCAPGDIVVANVALSAPCEVFDPARLRKTGSLALYPGPQGPRLITARDLSGDRIWNPPRRGRDQ